MPRKHTAPNAAHEHGRLKSLEDELHRAWERRHPQLFLPSTTRTPNRGKK